MPTSKGGSEWRPASVNVRSWKLQGGKEEEAVVLVLQVGLQALRATDPGMSLLDALEYTTCDPDRRIALYGRCSGEDLSADGRVQGDPRVLKIASSSALDLALLERRAKAEGFQV
jgi:hypothetical protein